MTSSLDVEQQPSTAPPATVPTLRTVAVLSVTALLVVGQMYAPLPLLDEIGAAMHVSSDAAAWVSSVFGFAYALGMLVAGPLSDTLGRRRVGVAGLLAAAVASGIVALAPTFPMLLASRALQGCAAAFFPPVALAYLTERVPARHRTISLTTTISAFLMAAIVAPLAASGLAEIGGWRTWFVVSAPLLLLLAGTARLTLYPDPVKAGTASVRTQLLRLPGLLRHPRLIALFVTTMTVMWVYVGMTTLAQLAGPGTAEDPTAMRFVRLATLPVFVVMVLLTPLLVRVSGTRRLITALAVVVVSLLATVLATGAVTLAVGLAVLSAGVIVIAPAMVETIGATSPPDQRGSATAVYGTTLFIGASLAAPTATTAQSAGFGVGTLVLAAIAALGLLSTALATRP